jgi:hypothetical protein
MNMGGFLHFIPEPGSHFWGGTHLALTLVILILTKRRRRLGKFYMKVRLN